MEDDGGEVTKSEKYSRTYTKLNKIKQINQKIFI